MKTYIGEQVKRLRKENKKVYHSRGKFGTYLHQDIEAAERKFRR